MSSISSMDAFRRLGGKHKNSVLAVKTSPPHPGWLEMIIDIHPVAHEALSAFLFDLGCEGIVSEEHKTATLKAYLPFEKDIEETRDRLELFLQDLGRIFSEAGSYQLTLNRMENQDWDLLWRDFFQKDRITERLMVIPAWEPAPPAPECHIIRIDPGPAFGTGKHATTRMCLKAMESASPVTGWKMLDVGTGSGILAIYGAKLGAQRVAAIDIDPEALRWAKRNIELNDLPIGIELSARPFGEWDEQFTLITANIVLHTIVDLSPSFPDLLLPQGRVILSGILREQEGEVDKRLAACGFVHEQVFYEDEWVCMVYKKRKADPRSGGRPANRDPS